MTLDDVDVATLDCIDVTTLEYIDVTTLDADHFRILSVVIDILIIMH